MNIYKKEQEEEDELKRRMANEVMALPDMKIAVSGLAGRFPKSDSVNEFEENLYEGRDMVNDNDESRFSCRLWDLPPRAGRLKELNRFDGEFFGYSPEEANYIDYQMRILYEVVYESILDAGLNPASLRGSNTGVFFGLHCNEFENAMADDPQFRSNGYFAQFASRVAEYFDFRGLTMTFDAACASGFVSLHNAVQALREGQIEQAIVCSSNIPIHPTGSFIFLQMQMLSPTGYSRFLDSRADGYVKSESVVSVLLQRKDVALRNYASIMATMTSVDGFKKEGITFPSDRSQEELMRNTKRLAGLSSNHVEYLEAHGTGTPAGDPQEARAIASVYCPSQESIEAKGLNWELEERKIGPLLVGSVKTNMGHSEAASGLCALVKIALMLENEIIYQSLHYEQPNKNVEALMEGKLKLVEKRTRLNSKIVPISCYGFGGSNVHAILRANERRTVVVGEETEEESKSSYRLVVMFGRNQQLLENFFWNLQNTGTRATRNCLSPDFLALIDQLSCGPIDRLMNHRGYLILDNERQEVCRRIAKCELPALRNQVHSSEGRPTHLQDCRQRKCNLILPGLGCQWPGMAAGLTGCGQFWCTIERLDELLRDATMVELDLPRLLTGPEEPASMLEKFVAIVAYQIALVNMVKNQLKLDNLTKFVGHSLGELSCAYAAGVIDERETIMSAYQLGSTLDQLKPSISGKMVAVSLSAQEASSLISNNEHLKSIQISCVNGPQSVTVSGSKQEMDEFCLMLQRYRPNELSITEVEASFALHNERIMTQEVKLALRENLLKVLFPLTIRDRRNTGWISTVATEEASLLVEANADYFAECLCKRVDFQAALDELEEDSICMELGPHGLFESQLRQQVGLSGMKNIHYVKLMRRSLKPEEQELHLLEALGNLYLLGASFDLTRFYHGDKKTTVFPVRRQTPSLSSLFSWNHQHDFFVPRYPIQFSKSSAKCEIPVDILQERDKYMVGHCVEGRILFPATGYLFLIWRAFSFTKRKIYDACFHSIENELVPIEFHNVRLLRAVILGNRSVQLYIHYEEGTGKFEIKEGGSVVVEGWVRSPEENPEGLLYDQVRDLIREEKLEVSLNQDDIYKQFRVSGYDYGETFRNIKFSSVDGRFSQIKFNGYFVSLTDSILQTIFLAVSQYAPSGGLFLPTKFEYVRFHPSLILDKLRKFDMRIDLSDSSLNTTARRDIMTKIMQRDGASTPEVGQEEGARESSGGESRGEERPAEEKEKPECIFETFCDPVTGIIISDGIEMRGIKATPAPRRQDNNEILLESYQFVRDFEDPLDDERLTRYNELNMSYIEVCNLASEQLLERVCGLGAKGEEMEEKEEPRVLEYKRKHLGSLFKTNQELDVVGEGDPEYDIKKNKNLMLLSVLDQLKEANNQRMVKEIVERNRDFLMKDLIQSSFESERYMRPLMETVIENSCTRKMKLKYLEINLDDGLLREPLQHLLKSIEPTLAIEYSLAHPNIDRLHQKKLLPAASGNQPIKTYALRNLSNLFSEHHLAELDLIVYKDISCYSLPKQVIERNGLEPVLKSLNNNVKLGGFVLIYLRQKLTRAERVLLALSEPELVGVNRKDLLEFATGGGKGRPTDKIEHINTILEHRYDQMLEEAKRNQMVLLASKSDKSGCSLLLFRSTINETSRSETNYQQTSHVNVNNDRLLLQITHDSHENIESWLAELKQQFAEPVKANSELDDQSQEKEAEEPINRKEVWLCAVATRDHPISGLIGMTRALLRELGSSRIRCFLDNYTFRNRTGLVSVAEIEASDNFRRALKRNTIWNCVDSSGYYGSYRHFTINSYMSGEAANCHNVSKIADESGIVSDSAPETSELPLVCGAYVNNATRGDLSSFTWFEGPFKYQPSEENMLVRVAYSALNFRDIMLASGRLPLDAIPIRLATSDCLLGLEFSGFDRSNRRVMGMVPGRGIATHILCDPRSSFKVDVPDWMSLEEAATIPVVYATVILALIVRGRIRPGESILIHAGSGGVGQAAIRLAANHKLKIYTTVGSDEKRDFLVREFGDFLSDEDIFNSRDCNFEDRILTATQGRGVDLILNSLADDKLEAGVRCLADGGRFLEIGKYDMSVDNKLELLRLDTNKTFHGILLDKLFDSDEQQLSSVAFKKQLNSVLETLNDGLQRGYVKPIKYTIFRKEKVEEAMRYMAAGKHIGKVLIEIDADLERKVAETEAKVLQNQIRLRCVPRFQLAPEKVYLVTGGLGGFGMELVKWLCQQGARYLVITSRRGLTSGYQKATLERLAKSLNVNYNIVTYDTTVREGVERLLKESRQLAPSGKLGGLFHLAMVLKDSLLENMTSEMFELVIRPKVNTLVHFHGLLEERKIELDYFVAFSSITSGKGNAGQSNYAYANSCLEMICEHRRAAGKHALAIQWGAIGDVGVVYENLGGNEVVIGGTVPQRMPSCLTTLSRLLCSPFAVCLSLVAINRRNQDEAAEKMDLVGAIMHVLGIKDSSKVSEQANLGELGLDSLMAVEIRQYIEREYDMTLNIQEIRALTVGKIREISEAGPAKPKPTGAATSG